MGNYAEQLSIALKSEGYLLEMHLIEIKGDYISKICVIEEATSVKVYTSSKLSEIFNMVELDMGRRWMRKKRINTAGLTNERIPFLLPR